jgi:hypothetical protein
MVAFIKKYPAIALFLLASALAVLPMSLVWLGVLPAWFSQLGALSASAAGIILAAVESGRVGVSELARRGLIWRVQIRWWIFAIVFTGIISLLTLMVSNWTSVEKASLAGAVPWYEIFSMAIVLTLFAGLGEEYGWRGYLVPRLQARHTALVTGLIIGAFHTLWHLPMFFMPSQSQYEWAQRIGLVPAFLAYMVCVTAWAIQMIWVFNNTRGSVLLSAVIHGFGNMWMGGFFDLHTRAGIKGSLILTALMVIASAIIVVATGPTNFSRKLQRQTL